MRNSGRISSLGGHALVIMTVLLSNVSTRNAKGMRAAKHVRVMNSAMWGWHACRNFNFPMLQHVRLLKRWGSSVIQMKNVNRMLYVGMLQDKIFTMIVRKNVCLNTIYKRMRLSGGLQSIMIHSRMFFIMVSCALQVLPSLSMIVHYFLLSN